MEQIADPRIRRMIKEMPDLQAAAWNAYSPTLPTEERVPPDVLAAARRLAEQGRGPAAEELLRGHPALDQTPEALNALGLILQRQDRVEESFDAFMRAIAVHQAWEARLWFNMANGYIMRRDWSAAIEASRTATTLAPQSPGGWVNLLFALAKRGGRDELLAAVNAMDEAWPAARHDEEVRKVMETPIVSDTLSGTIRRHAEPRS